MTEIPDILVGQVWRDLDPRSNYDVDPATGLPIAGDFAGLLGQRPRLVEVERTDATHVYVRALHNQRSARIQRGSFYASDRNRRGGRRTLGFVRADG